jgi:phosphatidylserine decarboxylase
VYFCGKGAGRSITYLALRKQVGQVPSAPKRVIHPDEAILASHFIEKNRLFQTKYLDYSICILLNIKNEHKQFQTKYLYCSLRICSIQKNK